MNDEWTCAPRDPRLPGDNLHVQRVSGMTVLTTGDSQAYLSGHAVSIDEAR